MDLTEAEKLARLLLDEAGLSEWKLAWNRRTTVYGVTWHRAKTIELSKKLTPLLSQDQLFEVVTHEAAHALCNVRHGHDATWRRMHRQLGGSGNRLLDGPSLVKQNANRYEGTCPLCGKKFHRDRNTGLARGYTHTGCVPSFEERHRDPDGPQKFYIVWVDTRTGRLVA